MLATRKAHDQVGTQRRVLARQRGLLDEVAVGDHPRQLDDVPELHLSPLSAGVRLAQRGHQCPGLGSQLLPGLRQRSNLGIHPAPGLAPLLIELHELGIYPPELLAQRRHQLLDRVLAAFEIAPSLGLRSGQLSARELDQLTLAGLERLGAQRLERHRQTLLGVLERGQTLLRPRPLVLEVRSRAHQLALELAGLGRLNRQRPQSPAEQQPGQAGAKHQSK